MKPNPGNHDSPLEGPQFAPGQRVRVAEGVFSGVEGIIAEFGAPGRVVIALDLRQRGIFLELNEDLIALAE